MFGIIYRLIRNLKSEDERKFGELSISMRRLRVSEGNLGCFATLFFYQILLTQAFRMVRQDTNSQ